MCCRSQHKKELLTALEECFAKTDSTWDTIVKSLQPPEDESFSRDRANAFLPYASHPCFDDIAEDYCIHTVLPTCAAMTRQLELRILG